MASPMSRPRAGPPICHTALESSNQLSAKPLAPPRVGKLLTAHDGEAPPEDPEFFGVANFVIPGLQNQKVLLRGSCKGDAVWRLPACCVAFLRCSLARRTPSVVLRAAWALCMEDVQLEEMIRMVDRDADGTVKLSGLKELFLHTAPIFKNYDLLKREALGADPACAGNQATCSTIASKKKKKKMVYSREAAAEIMQEFTTGKGLKPSFVKATYERFYEMDQNGNGEADYNEFCHVLDSEPSPLLHNLFKMFDKNGSGQIDVREFLVGMSAFSTSSQDDKLKFSFMLFDENQSGVLERDEVVKIVTATSPDLSKDSIQLRVNELYGLIKVPPRAALSFDNFKELVRQRPQLVAPTYEVSRKFDELKEQ